jgi:hypothetical protein
MWRALVLSLVVAFLATGASAQTPRPSPTMFKSGDCKADECARSKWLDFL